MGGKVKATWHGVEQDPQPCKPCLEGDHLGCDRYDPDGDPCPCEQAGHDDAI